MKSRQPSAWKIADSGFPIRLRVFYVVRGLLDPKESYQPEHDSETNKKCDCFFHSFACASSGVITLSSLSQ